MSPSRIGTQILYSRLQGTGQQSQCVYTSQGRRNAVVCVRVQCTGVLCARAACVCGGCLGVLCMALSDKTCEGDGDVVGVVTPLREVAQVVLHGIQVVEVGVRLRVHQDGEVEEDGEGRVEAEREEGEVKERRSWMG